MFYKESKHSLALSIIFKPPACLANHNLCCIRKIMSDLQSKVSKELEPWSHLNGKVVLITGASSGSGREFSILLAKNGCKVIAAARRLDLLNSVCDLIYAQSSETPRAVALELDVTAEPQAVEAAIQKAWSAFGQIDVLINNAGLRGY